jgi:hypothetical protein
MISPKSFIASIAVLFPDPGSPQIAVTFIFILFLYYK